MAKERLGNLGYLAIGTETTKGTAVTPTFYTLLYEENLTTSKNFQKQQPAAGVKFATYGILPGQRDHQGDITVVSEPNTNAHLYDMLLSRITNSGSGPYIQVFGFSTSVDPKSKTLDISKGNVVTRFWGVEAKEIAATYDNNEERKKLSVSALGSFQSRTIATISTVTITLDTTYDPAPNTGLVAGDLVRIYKPSTGATLDTTIAASGVNADGITVTLSASAAAFATGDIIQLRPATPNFNLLATQQWARTEFHFSDTYANALTAAQTRVEKGSTYTIKHDFENDGGAQRSGAYDPAGLPRLTGDATLTVKRFFDTPDQLQAFNDNKSSAVAIRKYAGTSYEERVGFYNVITDNPVGSVKSKQLIYANISYIPQVNSSDSLEVRVTIVHNLAII